MSRHRAADDAERHTDHGGQHERERRELRGGARASDDQVRDRPAIHR
jgi:hypothetical protein